MSITLDILHKASYHIIAGGKYPAISGERLLRRLYQMGCFDVRSNGSHFRVQCGTCQGTVPKYREPLSKKLMASIEKDFEACLGPDWLANLKKR